MTAPIQQISSQPPKGLPDIAYRWLKAFAQIILPALGALYVALASLWHWGYQAEVGGSIAALNTFIGAVVVVSKMLYDASSGNSHDGTFTLEPTEDGSQLRLLSVDPVALQTKGTVMFKMVGGPPS
jgi:hypothetical protein